MKLTGLSSKVGTALGVVGLLISCASVIFVLARDNLKEATQSLESRVAAQTATYHVPESEHLRLLAQTEMNTREWADVKARMAAQGATLDEVRATVARIEARMQK